MSEKTVETIVSAVSSLVSNERHRYHRPQCEVLDPRPLHQQMALDQHSPPHRSSAGMVTIRDSSAAVENAHREDNMKTSADRGDAGDAVTSRVVFPLKYPIFWKTSAAATVFGAVHNPGTYLLTSV
jgi:hypothetical protein